MTDRVRGKVRLVKCPKCATILEEPDQVPLYSCGGCDTVLQAKYYEGDNGAQRLSGGECVSSSQKSGSSSEQSTDQIEWRDKNIDETCKQEQAESPNSARNAISSKESDFPNNRENEVLENETFHERSNHVYELNQKDQSLEAANSAIEVSDRVTAANLIIKDFDEQGKLCKKAIDENHDLKQIRVVDSVRDTSTLNESSQIVENKESLRCSPNHTVLANTESQHPAVVGAVENKDDQCYRSSDNAFDNPKQVKEMSYDEDTSVLNESLAIENNKQLQLASEKQTAYDWSDHNSLGETAVEDLKVEHSHGDILVDEMKYLILERPSAISILGKENDNENQNDFMERTREQLGSLNVSEAHSLAEIKLGVDDASITEIKINSEPQCENTSVDKLSATLTNKIENFDDCATCEPDYDKSTEKPERLQPVMTQREAGSSLEVSLRSLTKGPLGYNESVSSFDGIHDEILERHEHLPDETLSGNGAVAGNVGAEESPGWSNHPTNRSRSSSTIENHENISSQVLLDEKMRSIKSEEEESVDENIIPERNRSRGNRDKFSPRAPFYQSSEVTYETGSSSSFVHDEIPAHQMHHHPYRYEDPEPWLRKSYSQKQNINRRIPEASWRENEFLSTYYNYETSGEFYHTSRYHNRIDRRSRRESWSQSHSSMPYSSAVTRERYQMQNPYVHRHSDDDLWWGPLWAPPISAVHRRRGLYADPLREMGWDPYDSNLSEYMGHEPYPYSRAHDPISFSNQRYEDEAMRRLYLREKRQTMRRYFQPVAGGAPFVTCNFCFNVLQLPKDFLIPKRSNNSTIHHLRCGDCSRILEFTLENESSLAIRKPNANVIHSQGSSSLAEEAQSSGKSKVESKKSGDRKKISKSHDTSSSSGEKREMKVTCQLSDSDRKSPLHRLMGYSSPNVLLNGQENENAE